MKQWFARVKAGGEDDYGRWIPTGCSDKDAAIEYMSTYPGARRVTEWLLL